jgi:uncharacterized surface protein with fasciclin (FAS1) repeats
MHRRVFATLVAGALALGIIAAPVAAAGPKGTGIVATAVAANESGPLAGQLDLLIAALVADSQANGSHSVLSLLTGNGTFTVFAPTDAAFEATLGELGLSVGDVVGDPALLNAILRYHVVRGSRDSADVLGATRLRTVGGAFIRQSGGQLIDRTGATSNAGFVAVDVRTANGIIHVIDHVLVP